MAIRGEWTIKSILEDDDRLERIYNGLESWSQLTELNIKLETLGDVGASFLAEVLNTTQLEEMNVSGCGIGEEGIVVLASSLRTNTTLNHLAIGGNQITEHGKSVLAEALTENKTLKTLDTRGTRFCVSFAEDDEAFV